MKIRLTKQEQNQVGLGYALQGGGRGTLTRLRKYVPTTIGIKKNNKSLN
jgi:hypothetical protein